MLLSIVCVFIKMMVFPVKETVNWSITQINIITITACTKPKTAPKTVLTGPIKGSLLTFRNAFAKKLNTILSIAKVSK